MLKTGWQRGQRRLGKGVRRPELAVAAQRVARNMTIRQVVDIMDKAAGWVSARLTFDHRTDDLAVCDAAARRVRRYLGAAGAFGGAATGIGGLAAAPADMVSSLLITAATVHATAAAYGFTENTPRDRLIRLHAVDLALARTGQSQFKKTAVTQTILSRVKLSDDTMTAAMFNQAMQAILPGMIDNLISGVVTRSGGKVVPVVSAATGGVLGYQLQDRVWKAAAFTYRQRWLIERRVIAAPADRQRMKMIESAALPGAR